MDELADLLRRATERPDDGLEQRLIDTIATATATATADVGTGGSASVELSAAAEQRVRRHRWWSGAAVVAAAVVTVAVVWATQRHDEVVSVTPVDPGRLNTAATPQPTGQVVATWTPEQLAAAGIGDVTEGLAVGLSDGSLAAIDRTGRQIVVVDATGTITYRLALQFSGVTIYAAGNDIVKALPTPDSSGPTYLRLTGTDPGHPLDPPDKGLASEGAGCFSVISRDGGPSWTLQRTPDCVWSYQHLAGLDNGDVLLEAGAQTGSATDGTITPTAFMLTADCTVRSAVIGQHAIAGTDGWVSSQATTSGGISLYRDGDGTVTLTRHPYTTDVPVTCDGPLTQPPTTASPAPATQLPSKQQSVAGVGRFAYHAISAFDSIWILAKNSDTVTRLDAATGDVLATLTLPPQGGALNRLTASSAAIYVSSTPVMRIDPATNEMTAITGDIPSGAIIANGDTVWTASPATSPVHRIDPDGTVTTLDNTTGSWMDLAVSHGLIWAISQKPGDRRLIAFDGTTGDIVHQIDIATAANELPVRLVADDHSVVVGIDTSHGGGRTGELIIIDPATATITQTIELPARPEGIDLTARYIWTSGAIIDRTTLAVTPIELGFTITLGPDGSIWGTTQSPDGNSTATRYNPGTFTG